MRISLLICLFQFFSYSVLADARLSIHIYKYTGIHSDQETQYFDEFKAIVQAKILTLSEELTEFNVEYTKLAPFYVINQNGKHIEFTGSTFDLQNRWEISNVLEILHGRVRANNKQYSVKSRVFFGNLSTDLGSKFLSIELPIDDEQYETTKDSHSIAILYALALDARNRCRPENEVIALLSNAYEKLKDIPDSPKLAGIEKLRNAVETALTSSSDCVGSQ